MWKTFNCLTAIQGVFIVMFFLLAVVAIAFFNRSRHLRKKLSKMLEQMAIQKKELDEAKSIGQNILSPFIPETSRSIILSIDPSGKITDMNDYAAEIFGYQKEDLIGEDAFGTIFPEPAKKDSQQLNMIERIFANPKLYVEHETENIKKSGEHFWVSWTNRIMYDDNGKAIELRSVGFDITKRKQLEEELRYLASVDPQTGTLNRQALIDAGMHELKRSQRYKRNMAILLLKLDYFHGADDSHGFSDDIVRKVITIVRASVRDSDFIGRVGDVEFAMILPETSAKEAAVVATRIKEKIQDENLKYNGNFFVTVSFGIAEKTQASDTIDSLLLKALNSVQKTLGSDAPKQSKPRKKKGV